MPHHFRRKRCDNAEMDQEQNPVQRREQQRIARNRRLKPLHLDRLTPTDLLKLIPSPIVLSDCSLAGYARRLEQRRERLQRLTARFAGKEFVTIPRQIHLPKLTSNVTDRWHDGLQ
jgi:hypothetical protein